MHLSPDKLTAIGSGSLYKAAEQSRQPHHATALSAAVRWTAEISSTQPDYGCVDWFVYDEHHRSEQESA